MAYSYNFIEHTADIAFEAAGDTIEELFVAAAEGWKYTVLEDASVDHIEQKPVELKESSAEELLVYFLDELNFLLNTKGWVLSVVKQIKIEQAGLFWKLKAVLSGESYNASRHDIKIEIKAITFHQMAVQYVDGKYKTRVVFDI